MVLTPPEGWWPRFWHMDFWMTHIQTTAHTYTACVYFSVLKTEFTRMSYSSLFPIEFSLGFHLVWMPFSSGGKAGFCCFWCIDLLMPLWLTHLTCSLISTPKLGTCSYSGCPEWATPPSLRCPQDLHHWGGHLPYLLSSSSSALPWVTLGPPLVPSPHKPALSLG